MNTFIFVLLIIILIALFAIAGFLVYFFGFKNKAKNSSSKNNKKQFNKDLKQYHKKLDQLDNLKNEYHTKLKELSLKIENVHNLKLADIKKELENQVLSEYNFELKNKLDDLKKDYEINKTTIANNILLEVLERSAEPLIMERTTTSVVLEDDSLKGRIIGRDGRNKRLFEMLTGADLIIDKESSMITVSTANPIRREIAINTLKKLIISKNILPSKIESVFADETANFEKHVIKIGEEVWLNNLQLDPSDNRLYYYIGRLKFRSSYGQNALSHSVECALLASHIAQELNLDCKKARMIAFLHDIGKSNDYEVDKNHVDSGIQIAAECNLDDNVKNAILSHHGDVECSNIYSNITKIADMISAARPGARINSYEEYFERVKKLEEICNGFDEVNSSYVIKSGRQLRVLINPSKVLDKNLEAVSLKIKKSLESDPLISKFKIKVILIKENRYEFETTATN